METFYNELIMETLTEIFTILKTIVFFWIIVGLAATGVYCTVRLISYAIYKSKLQAYFNLKTEEEANDKEEKER